MSEHPHVALVKKLYRAFNEGDLNTMAEIFHPDVTWHAAGQNWLVGTYTGLEGVLGLLGTMAQYGEGNYTTALHDVVANDRYAIAMHRSTAWRSDGRELSVDDLVVSEFEDGKVVRVWATPYDQYEEDRFYGDDVPEGFAVPAGRTSAVAESWSPRPADLSSPVGS